MANYLTSVGVQQVSVTISAGNTSGTATISAVGSKAFVVWAHYSSTTSSVSPSNGFGRVEITNSTTITCTRSGTLGSMVFTVSVVDASSDLIASVQSGTITITTGNTSNTASITSTTANNSALQYLGTVTGDTTQADPTQKVALTYSGTTVTATVNTVTTANLTVGFMMIEFNGSALNQANQIFASAYSATTTNVTITAVATANTILIFGGTKTQDVTYNVTNCRLNLSSTTNVQIIVNSAGTLGSTCNFTVVEFASGVLSQAVQRGSITLNAVTSNTATITSVNTTKAIASQPGLGTSNSSNRYDRAFNGLALTNSTTLTETKGAATNTSTGGYEIAEFSSILSSSNSNLLLLGVG